MFSYINGEITEKECDRVVVDVGGVGFELFCSDVTLSQCAVGECRRLYVYLQVKEDGLTLYGFDSLAEKQVFLDLISVSGVGPKLAIAVLTETLPPSIPAEVSTLQQELEAECRMESELQSLVLFFALVCIVVTLLGVYAAITLDTERRRKEVAIRKVNGAGRRQIFAGRRQIFLLFARMYGWLLAGSAAVAFPLVYLVLREWQTAYVAFFSYGPLFWLGIFLAVALVTALTVVFRIGKIARLNPAEAIKAE